MENGILQFNENVQRFVWNDSTDMKNFDVSTAYTHTHQKICGADFHFHIESEFLSKDGVAMTYLLAHNLFTTVVSVCTTDLSIIFNILVPLVINIKVIILYKRK